MSPFVALRPPHRLSEMTTSRICLGDSPTGLDPDFQHGAVPILLRPPFADNGLRVVAE